MTIALATAVVLLLVIETVVRLRYPKPRPWLKPQVQVALDDQVGYSNRPNQRAFSRDAVANINSLGFRGPEIKLGRQPGSLRILGLGNSITFGGGVEDDQTYLAYLNDRLSDLFPGRQVEVLNAAIYGFTIRQFVPFLEAMLPRVKPDIVLLGTCWRDLHFHPRLGQLKGKVDAETWKMIKKKFRERDTKVVHASRRDKLTGPAKKLVRHWRTLYVGIYLFRALRDWMKPPSYQLWRRAFLSGQETEPIRQRRAEAKKTLSRMQEICTEQHAKFGVLVFPDYRQIMRAYPKSTWPSLMVEACQELGIPSVDLLAPIRREYDEHGRSIFQPYDDDHYSAECNRAIAQAVHAFLSDERMLTEQASAVA